MWRWTGFNMGLDLIITFDDYTISLKRSLTASGNVEHEALLSNHKKRHIFYRVCVVSLNSQKQVVYQANSSIKSLTLSRNQTHEILQIDKKKATFPLLLSFNFAVNTPLNIKEETDDSIDQPAVETVELIKLLFQLNSQKMHTSFEFCAVLLTVFPHIVSAESILY